MTSRKNAPTGGAARRTRPSLRDFGSDIHGNWRGPVLRGAIGLQTVLALAMTVVVAVLPETNVATDMMILWPMPLLAVSVVGALWAARSGPGASDPGTRLARAAINMGLVAAVGVAQLAVALPLHLLDVEAAVIMFGSVIAGVLGGPVVALLLCMAGYAVYMFQKLPREVGLPGRLSAAGLMVSTLAMPTAAVLSTSDSFRGAGVIAVLLGLNDDVDSPAWAWTARVLTIVLVASLILLRRALREAGVAPARRPGPDTRA
ncbi:hypothetical protein V6U90_28335 [Micromonospora sp. CPCC 206060]|uniref:hypothetical protein n=1 Tax=Micromonospora sp. CPCC 206060 TaxID=3122406 RepID=UPI002FF35C39